MTRGREAAIRAWHKGPTRPDPALVEVASSYTVSGTWLGAARLSREELSAPAIEHELARRYFEACLRLGQAPRSREPAAIGWELRFRLRLEPH